VDEYLNWFKLRAKGDEPMIKLGEGENNTLTLAVSKESYAKVIFLICFLYDS